MPAWPLSRIQTFLANSVPVISASFLHGVQDVVVALFNGVISVKSLVADATGANVVAPTAGDIVASRSLKAGRATSGTTTPTPTTISGEVGKGGAVLAWAFINADGTLGRGYGIEAVSRASTGIYDVKHSAVVSDPDHVMAVASAVSNNPPVWCNVVNASVAAGKATMRVHCQSTGPTYANTEFYIVFFGE